MKPKEYVIFRLTSRQRLLRRSIHVLFNNQPWWISLQTWLQLTTPGLLLRVPFLNLPVTQSARPHQEKGKPRRPRQYKPPSPGTASLSVKQGPSQTRRASTDPHMAHPRSLGTPARPSTLPSRPPPPTRPYAYRHRPSGSLPSQQSSTPASPF